MPVNVYIRPEESPPAIRRADCVCACHRGRRSAALGVECARSAPCTAGAFTLIEVIFVVLVVSIVGGMATLRFSGALTNYRADAAAARIVQDIAMAQSRARATSQSRTLTFLVAQNTYTVSGEVSIKNPSAPYTVSLAEEPYRCTLKTAGFPNAPQLTFDGYGKPGSGGTIRLVAGSAARIITVDADTGQTSITK